jgi:hypothetical protein
MLIHIIYYEIIVVCIEHNHFSEKTLPGSYLIHDLSPGL